MLDAAREMFVELGYEATTTKAVAARADVSEAVLFRNFGSKESLFEAAVLEPFQQFVETYTESWRREAGVDSVESIMRTYVEAVFEMVERHRPLLATLVRNGLGLEGLKPAISRLEVMGQAVAREYRLEYDTAVAVRATLLMVVGAALAEGALFDGEQPIEVGRVKDELTRMLIAAAVLPPSRDRSRDQGKEA